MRGRSISLAVGILLLATGQALAHPGHDGQEGGQFAWLPAALFLASVGLLAGAVYLDREGDVGPRTADVGVGLGVLGIVASIGLLLL